MTSKITSHKLRFGDKLMLPRFATILGIVRTEYAEPMLIVSSDPRQPKVERKIIALVDGAEDPYPAQDYIGSAPVSYAFLDIRMTHFFDGGEVIAQEE